MTMDQIEREIEVLADLGRAELVEAWRSHYRSDPPKGLSRRLLVRAVAYAMQAKRYGGLKPATERRLGTIVGGTASAEPSIMPTKPNVKVPPRTRLVREWNGVTHVVEVVEGGVLWNGARYRSLSAVARAITGARWSGPRFFGLTSGEAP